MSRENDSDALTMTAIISGVLAGSLIAPNIKTLLRPFRLHVNKECDRLYLTFRESGNAYVIEVRPADLQERGDRLLELPTNL